MAKTILIIFIAVFFTCSCFAQDSVEVKNRLTDSVIEHFYALKPDKKIKNGPYKALFKRRVLIAAGNYNHDKRVGSWRFYDIDARLIERYNYDTKVISYEGPLGQNTDLAFLFDAKIKITDTVTRPIKIGGSYFGYIPYLNAFKAPFDTFEMVTNSFDVTVELLITPLGRLADYKVHLVSNYYQYTRTFSLDTHLFSEADRTFLPATLNKEPVLCRVIVRCILNDEGGLDFY